MLGLFFKFVDRAVGARVHDTEAGRLFERHIAHGDGAVGVVLLVEADHSGVVHLVDVVAREDQHVIRIVAVNKSYILIDGVGRALVPFGVLALGVGRQHLHAAVRIVQTPRLAVADVLIELQRLILGQNTHRIDLRVDTVGQREIDDTVFSAERHGRFGRVLRQDHEAAALSACQ